MAWPGTDRLWLRRALEPYPTLPATTAPSIKIHELVRVHEQQRVPGQRRRVAQPVPRLQLPDERRVLRHLAGPPRSRGPPGAPRPRLSLAGKREAAHPPGPRPGVAAGAVERGFLFPAPAQARAAAFPGLPPPLFTPPQEGVRRVGPQPRRV